MFKKKYLAILFLCGILLSNYKDFTNAFIDVSKKSNPAIVSIISQKEVEVYNPFKSHPFFQDDFFPKDFFGFPDESYKSNSLGSGVIIDAEKGYIITNSHVINKSDEIKVVLYDKREYEATIIGEDPLSDIAVIQIDNDSLTNLTMGDSDDLQVGQWVIAIGSPFGLHLNHTVTAGIVSAIGRSDVMSKMNYENFIQHDAAINPGNSGGALLDLEGNLIGINTAIATRSGQNAGVGFAVPINQAKKVANDLIETGTVKRGWLGITIQDITDDMKSYWKLKNKKGALVSQILENSPAEKSGLKEEDIIIKVNNDEIENSSDLRNTVSENYPNKEITLTVLRDNKKKKIKVLLGERPTNESLVNGDWNKNEEFDILGLKIESSNNNGVKITDIKPDSSAGREDLRVDDVIKSIGRRIINSPSDYFDMIENYDEGDTVMMKVIRNNNARYIAFQIK
tara:strand:- start:1570 stop:2928 length:1359 start_codon:yes stop_codon:yes gene_type:complete